MKDFWKVQVELLDFVIKEFMVKFLDTEAPNKEWGIDHDDMDLQTLETLKMQLYFKKLRNAQQWNTLVSHDQEKYTDNWYFLIMVAY